MDQYSSDTGNLNVIVAGTDSYSPLSSATIEIANTGEPNRILESITTDQNGQTGYIELSAPPREYSMEPTDNQPYSEYNLKISAPGYQEGLISGVQIFSGENGLQSIVLLPSEQTPDYVYNPIVIGGHTLWEYYPPKIAEPEIKPLAESGEIVLSRVSSRKQSLYTTVSPATPLLPIIMSHTSTTSKMSPAVNLLHLPEARSKPIFWQSCPSLKPGIYRMVQKQIL